MPSFAMRAFLLSFAGLVAGTPSKTIFARQSSQSNTAQLVFFSDSNCQTGEHPGYPTINKTPDGSLCWVTPSGFPNAIVTGDTNCNTTLFSDNNCKTKIDDSVKPNLDCHHGVGSALTSCSSASAQYSNIPSGYQPSNLPWDKIQCNSPGVNNTNLPQSERWTLTKAEDAWNAAIAQWGSGSGSGIGFVQNISNFFNGPESMGCGKTSTSDGCVQDVRCDSGQDLTPAGYQILNSMINLNNMFNDVWNGFVAAQSSIALLIGTFTNDFAVVNNEAEKTLELVLSFLALGYTAAITPVWAHLLKEAAYFKTAAGKPLADDIKDETNGLVTNGLKIAQDFNDEPSFDNLAELSDIVAKTIKTWSDGIAAQQESIFSGTSDAITLLHSLITNGSMMEIAQQLEPTPMIITAVSQVIWLKLMPTAWSLSNENLGPVILSTGAACSLPFLDANPIPKDVSNNDFKEVSTCVNGKSYFLVSTTGNQNQCNGVVDSSDGLPCPNNTFSKLPGTDSLDGTQWSGLTVIDVITAAVNTFTAAGSKNNVSAVPDVNDATIENIFTQADLNQTLNTPGLVNIPVCSVDEARYNWQLRSKTGTPRLPANYPCN